MVVKMWHFVSSCYAVAIMLSSGILSVAMLSVALLNVVLLSVGAPRRGHLIYLKRVGQWIIKI